LAKLPADPGRLAKEIVERDRRERILLAAIEVFGERGFAATTVKDLIEGASVSRATFYKYFPDKETCLAAAHAEALAWLEEEARAAAVGAADWADAVVAVAGRLVELLAADPRLARFCAGEWRAAGAAGRARHEAALAALEAELRKGRAEQPPGRLLPASLEALVVAGALAVLGRTVRDGRRSDLEALARELPEIVLIVYLGPAAAKAALARRA
jgi:AcrR family transcriptional regulator